jgi:hypothetical protein
MESLQALTPVKRTAVSVNAGVRVALFVLFLTSELAAHATFAASDVTSGEPLWKNECSTCHIAYPPKLLAAPAWRGIMTGLEKHFGTDASVDAPTVAAIRAYLEQYAGKEGRASAVTLRITDTPWFRREHDEVSAAVWKKPAVKSASNCGACHTAADRGDFRERNVRIPK